MFLVIKLVLTTESIFPPQGYDTSMIMLQFSIVAVYCKQCIRSQVIIMTNTNLHVSALMQTPIAVLHVSWSAPCSGGPRQTHNKHGVSPLIRTDSF